jgi:hypothetical protein
MTTMLTRLIAISTVFALSAGSSMISRQSSEPLSGGPQAGLYNDSLVVAPHYVEFVTDTDERFAHQALELKKRLGYAPHVLVGFAASLPIQIPSTDPGNPGQKLEKQMASTLDAIDQIVERARKNHVIVHITLTSGFFHGMNPLRPAAILQDVRNAQWYADGWISDPASMTDAAVAAGDAATSIPPTAWITPSRYARPLRARMEQAIRLVGSRLASAMAEHPETLLTISGDGEVELNYERSISGGNTVVAGNQPIYADYSPFMVEEFRDWIENDRYKGDKSPDTDDNRDGRTFNRDFKTSFKTWRLRYFDSSGPIPFSTYTRMPVKLPSNGPSFIEAGFDAPRIPQPKEPFWELWMKFREQTIANYERDFASWITSSPSPDGKFRVPASHFYSHQIPADFLFEQKDGLRLRTSASPARTAFISPVGSSGVTVFNTYDGRVHKRTGTSALFEQLSLSGGGNWGVLEYNPSMPAGPAGIKPSSDMAYYMGELRTLYAWRPHVIVPFAWTDIPAQKTLDIQNSTFESALKLFIAEVGNTPWSPRSPSPK